MVQTRALTTLQAPTPPLEFIAADAATIVFGF